MNRPPTARFAPPALLLILAASAGPASGQQANQTADPQRQLAAIDSLIDQSRTDEARNALDRWKRSFPSDAPGVSPALRAHALLLQARLARDWAAAEEAYLAIVLGYPTAAVAPEALLRLGQGLLASARTSTGIASTSVARAEAYLHRLVTDYPTSPLRAAGLLWLARALRASGRNAAACARLATAAQIATDPPTSRLIEDERRACAPLPRDIVFLAK